MSGFFDSGTTPAAQTSPEITGIKVTTSSFGGVIPVGAGRFRCAANLADYDDFQKRARETGSGKGGNSGALSTTYNYFASLILILAQTVITQVRTVWQGKEAYRAIEQTVREQSATDDVMVNPTVPFNVPHTATYVRPVSLIIPGEVLNYPDIELVQGVHYSVAAGVYTILTEGLQFFPGEFGPAPRIVRATYIYTTPVDAQSALAQLGLTLKSGGVDQPAWQYWADKFPAKSLNYPALAYLHGRDFALDQSAGLTNPSFECDGPFQLSATVPDVDPSVWIREIITNQVWGAGAPSSYLADLTQYSKYCIANGLLISPYYDSQRPARDCIAEILEATNSMPVNLGDRLAIVPLGDQAATGNGVTYTPTMTLAADFVPDDFVGSGPNPVTIRRKDASKAFNKLGVEYLDRAQDYRPTVATWTDDAAIAQYGERAAPARSYHFICDAKVALAVATILGRSYQSNRAMFTFSVLPRYMQLQQGDLVRLTDPSAGIDGITAIIRTMRRRDTSIDIEAEQFDVATNLVPLIPPQLGSGFRVDQNADPGSVTTPAIIEMPTPAGVELRVAASGANPLWGGAELYASLDGGASYKLVGRAKQSARYGTVSAVTGVGASATLDVTLVGQGGKLVSTAGSEADALATLCFVGDSKTGEWLSYQTATLLSPNTYRLTSLRRGRFGTSDRAHAVGETFVFVDGALAVAENLPTSIIGRTVMIKLASYNAFGAALQTLAQASQYAHQVTGRFVGATAIAIGNNRQPDSTFTSGRARWELITPAYIAPGESAFSIEQFGAPESDDRSMGGTLRTSPRNLVMRTNGQGPSSLLQMAGPYVGSVEPGTRVSVAILAWAYRCQAAIELVFYDAAGNVLSQAWSAMCAPSVTAQQVSDSSFNFERTIQDRAWYRRCAVDAVAPAGATRCRIQPTKGGNLPGYTGMSEVSWLEPQVDFVAPEALVPPAWTPGGDNSVGTAQIVVGSTAVTYTPLAAIPPLTAGPDQGNKVNFELFRFTPAFDGDLEIVINGDVVSSGGGLPYALLIGEKTIQEAPASGSKRASFEQTTIRRVTSDTEVVVFLSMRRVAPSTADYTSLPNFTGAGSEVFRSVTATAKLTHS